MRKLVVLSVLAVWGLVLAGRSEANEQPPPSSPVHTWNELALDTVRIERLSDAQAARLYAMVNVAMYDAVNGIESVRGRVKRDHALVDPAGAPIYGNRYAAASAAAHAVLTQEHSTLAAIYNAQLDADRAAIEDGPHRRLTVQLGARASGTKSWRFDRTTARHQTRLSRAA